MFRYLFNRLASEKLIEYLSETYVIKRAAQMTVAAYYKISGEKRFSNLFQPGKFLNSFKGHLKKEIEDVQREVRKKQK
ncbi:uncharacterized protein LOC129573645 [Sitodiplosis mosellana]|uniref:uncharacterized protein LOC129573645 n=1 Tax=Sitodiplosis mosellana TaxID=263140 RepID=UPI002443BFF9|nr:uncharacterized protein LOC129573645 [Sitodiplosis mosellana]